MANTFKTPKGTVLTLLKLQGKDYMQVADRIIWFREENPMGEIRTSLVELDLEKKLAVARAEICVPVETSTTMYHTLASAHKAENAQGFGDYMEKAETGAVGRALAMCGYGTQFARPDIDEGSRIVDSPVAAQDARQAPKTPSSFPADIPDSESPTTERVNIFQAEVREGKKGDYLWVQSDKGILYCFVTDLWESILRLGAMELEIADKDTKYPKVIGAS